MADRAGPGAPAVRIREWCPAAKALPSWKPGQCTVLPPGLQSSNPFEPARRPIPWSSSVQGEAGLLLPRGAPRRHCPGREGWDRLDGPHTGRFPGQISIDNGQPETHSCTPRINQKVAVRSASRHLTGTAVCESWPCGQRPGSSPWGLLQGVGVPGVICAALQMGNPGEEGAARRKEGA